MQERETAFSTRYESQTDIYTRLLRHFQTTAATFSTPFSSLPRPVVSSTPKPPPKPKVSQVPEAAGLLTPQQMRVASRSKPASSLTEVGPELHSESSTGAAAKRKRSPEPEMPRTRPDPPFVAEPDPRPLAVPGPSTDRMDVDAEPLTVPAAAPLAGPPPAKPRPLPPRPRPKQDPANALFIPRAPKVSVQCGTLCLI